MLVLLGFQNTQKQTTQDRNRDLVLVATHAPSVPHDISPMFLELTKGAANKEKEAKQKRKRLEKPKETHVPPSWI
jgi:hypothetical protein